MFGFQVSIDTIVQKTLGLGFQNCKYGLVDVNVKITFVFCFSVNILFKGRFSISCSVLGVFSRRGALCCVFEPQAV